MFYSFLPYRGLLTLSGDDAHDFLQGLVSNDVRPLKEGNAVYAAMLSPQGKFLHDFFLAPHGETILLDCEKSRMGDLLQRLKMYRLRSKVAIDVVADNIAVAAMWPSSAIKPKDDVVLFADPRLLQLGWRVIGDAKAIEAFGLEKADAEAYDCMRLAIGVPDGSRDMIVDKSLLLEFGFEDLHGVDFTKGCYVGQEVTARSKHRAQLKKFIYQVNSDEDLPETGTPLMLDGAVAGELRSHAGNVGLALLKVADVERAHSSGTKFVCGNSTVAVVLPQWVVHPPKALVIEE